MNDKLHNRLSSNLRFIRASCNLTQEEFSSQIGVSRAAYGAYEEGRSLPPLHVLIMISNKVDYSIDEISTKDLSLLKGVEYGKQ